MHCERTRATASLGSRVLSARIVELEKARADLELARLSWGAETSGAPAGRGEPETSGQPAAVAATPAESAGPPGVSPDRSQRSQRSEAMQNMMRTQMRGNFRRMNADIGRRLGLSPEDANKLLDLMVDQQIEQREFGQQNRASNLTRAQRAAAYQAHQEQSLAAVSP